MEHLLTVCVSIFAAVLVAYYGIARNYSRSPIGSITSSFYYPVGTDYVINVYRVPNSDTGGMIQYIHEPAFVPSMCNSDGRLLCCEINPRNILQCQLRVSITNQDIRWLALNSVRRVLPTEMASPSSSNIGMKPVNNIVIDTQRLERDIPYVKVQDANIAVGSRESFIIVFDLKGEQDIETFQKDLPRISIHLRATAHSLSDEDNIRPSPRGSDLPAIVENMMHTFIRVQPVWVDICMDMNILWPSAITIAKEVLRDASLATAVLSSPHTVLMWSGGEDTIPPGWEVCKGSRTDQLDLRNRFIVGAGDKYSVGSMDGHDMVTLSRDNYRNYDYGSYAQFRGNRYCWQKGGDMCFENTHLHSDMQNAPFDAKPPYAALLFICLKI